MAAPLNGPRYAAIVASCRDAIYSKRLDGVIETWNPAAEQLFGYPPFLVIGESVSLLAPPERQHEMAELCARLAQGEEIPAFETVRQHRTGRLFPVELTLSPIRAPGAEIVGVSVIARDLSDRRRVEADLESAVQALKREDQAKDEFLAMLAHELRNPLGALAHALHAVGCFSPGSPEYRRGLETAQRQVRRQSHLLNRLLDVSQITHGQLILERQRLDLAMVVRDAGLDALPAANARPVQLLVHLRDTPVPVMGDWSRLLQALSCLLENGIRFTDPGGRVDLWLEVRGGEAVVTVSDTGSGIEAELQQHLFQPFVQEPQGLDRGSGGIGMGLALVRGLVELHGGWVQVQSDGRGTGSTFTLRLPLAPEPHVVLSGDTDIPAAPAPLRLLIVEDNQDAAETLSDLMSVLGYFVSVALTGPDGLRQARAERPDLILCDIGLPGMDGYELARTLRADPATAGIHMVAVTGYGGATEEHRARTAGFAHYLLKPVHLPQLEQILHDYQTAAAQPPVSPLA
jgi:two-component system CheB/CheR fusion protein